MTREEIIRGLERMVETTIFVDCPAHREAICGAIELLRQQDAVCRECHAVGANLIETETGIVSQCSNCSRGGSAR